MSEFLTEQLDYVYFFYGLSFMLLAALCLGRERSGDRRLPWLWLGLFGLAHGISEWLDLCALALGDSSLFSAVRTLVLLASFVFLAEFGRIGLSRATDRKLGWWIYSLGFVILAVTGPGGWESLRVGARYSFGLTGGLLATAALFVAARRSCPPLRHPLIAAGISLGMYALCAGLVVQKQHFFPASVLNREWFLAVFHMPVQFVRGFLALWCTASICDYASVMRSRGSEPGRSGIARHSEAITGLVTLCLVLGGWWLTSAIGQRTDVAVREKLRSVCVSAAACSDTEEVGRLKGSLDDLKSPDFRFLQHVLALLKSENPECRGAYLIGVRNGKALFYACSETPGSDLATQPGEAYQGVPAQAVSVFASRKAVTHGPYTDRWGRWVSGFAPLIDRSTHKVVAVLGMDIDAGHLEAQVRRSRLLGIAVAFVVCLVVVVLLTLLQNARDSNLRTAASEHRMRSLIDGSPSWITFFDTAGRFYSANEAGLVTMGWSRADVLGKRFADIWPESAQSLMEEAVCKVLGGEMQSFRQECRRADGSPVIWHVVLSPIPGLDGGSNGFAGVWTDLTESEGVQAALRESEEQYRAVVENASDGIFVVDSEGRYLDVNQRGCDIVGYSRDELIQMRISDLSLDEDEATALAAFAAFGGEGSWVRQYRLQRKDGAVIDCEISANQLPDGRGLGIVRDITERKRTEAALLESEERFRCMSAAAQDAFIMIDSEGRITLWNPAAQRVFGYSVDEAVGRPAHELLAGAEDCERYEGAVPEFRLSGRGAAVGETVELVAYAKGGRQVPVEMSLSSVRVRGEWNAIAIVRDITSRKEAEAAVRDSERNFRELFHNVGDAIFLQEITADGTPGAFVEANEVACQRLGYTREELLHLTSKDLWAFEECDQPQALMAELQSAGRVTFEMVQVAKDGERVPTEASAHVFVLNGREVLLSVARDITERKKAEEVQRIQSSAINAASDMVIIGDVFGNMIFANPAVERETGFSPEEVVGRSYELLSSHDNSPELVEQIWTTLLSGDAWRGELSIRRKDGSAFLAESNITPVKNEAGAIEHFVAIKRNITDKRAIEEQLDRLAHRDPLTGLPNRLLFGDRLNQSLALARRKGGVMAVMFLDLDRFKLINDTLGHNAGDVLLWQAAGRLTDQLREVDTIARMGGDEFTIILGDADSPENVAKVAQRVLSVFAEPFTLAGRELFVTTSVGIGLYPRDGEDVEELVKNADTAMYRAKEQGRNNYQFYTEELNTAAVEKITLETDLRKALRRDEFELHYQPQVDIRTGRILGVEALIRWHHPELGLVPPAQFIPLAEETGLIVPITDWVLKTACAQNKAWQDAGYAPVEAAVNISAKLLEHDRLVKTVTRVLARSGLDAKYLGLEVTESTIMRDAGQSERVLRKLKDMGARIHVDDFGTGHSSLSYLKRLPIDTVKIDQSFVRDITDNPDDAAIASAVVAMSHSLKLKVIAEGVETLQQLEFLRGLNCDQIQGYFISRPVPADDLAQLLRCEAGSQKQTLRPAA